MYENAINLDQIMQFIRDPVILTYHSGDMILQQGDECDEMFYIVEGSVRTVLLTRQGDEFLVSIHGQG